MESVDAAAIAFVIPLYSNCAAPVAMGVPRSDALFIRVNDTFVAFTGLSLEMLTTSVLTVVNNDAQSDNGLVTAEGIALIIDYIVCNGESAFQIDEDQVKQCMEKFHRSACCLLGGPISAVEKEAIDSVEFGRLLDFSTNIIHLSSYLLSVL